MIYRKEHAICFFCMILGVLLLAGNVFAQIPTGQDAGAVQRNLLEEKKDKEVKKKLEQKKDAQIDEQNDVRQEAPPVSGQKSVLIEKIVVEGVTYFKLKFIRSIVAPFEGKELSLSDFQKIADLITNEYRKAGLVTSSAYLAEQKISDNTLRISVIEGRVGQVNIEGNKWFNDKLINNYIDQRKDDIFNYESLRKNIAYMNEKRDIEAKVILARGKERGETDVNLKVEDQFPFHVNLGFSNYNSKYTERLKYTAEVLSTNFLGLGHLMSGEMQLGEADRYHLYTLRYLAPITPRSTIGLSYINLDQRLGREVGDLEIKGEGDIVSFYYAYKLIDTDDLSVSLNPGFVYKDIMNEVLESTAQADGGSEDRIRIAKLGFDIDYMDAFSGRTIIIQEFDFGLKDFMGGLSGKDVHASRSGAGAGGEFFRSMTNFARIQNLPYDISLMLKGAAQWTGDDLTSTEQFFIGGPKSVRGYPNSEFGGDKGLSMSSELYFPVYGLPKDLQIPYMDTRWYDAIRVVGFFDWGFVSSNSIVVGETKDETLYSCGSALRFNIPQRFSLSLDYGHALGQRSSDGSKSRLYIETKLYF